MFKDAFDLVYNKQGDEERIPKINPLIGEGVAYRQMIDLHQTIHQQLSTLLRKDREADLPEGFDYIGCEILTPEEEYDERGRRKNKQSNRAGSASEGFQYLPTDTYYVRFSFQNGDSVIERNMQIPFLRRGSIMQIVGTRYGISPVIKTRGVSITPKGFFVSFDSNQVNFERKSRSFLVNGTSRHFYLPVSNDLHRYKKKGSKAFNPPLVGWLFAKWGVKETFKRYLGVDAEFYADDDFKLRELDTEKYVVCRAPLPYKGERHSQFAVVLKKEDLTKHAEIFIGTLFYIAIFYGDRINVDVMDNVTLWRILLGYSVHGEGEYNDPKHLFMINKHLTETVEKYLDPIFQAQLLQEGLEFDDIYEFFFYIIDLYTKSGNRISGSLANTWGRYLTCAEYVLVGIRHNIRKCMWELKDAAKNTTTGESGLPVSKRRIESIINRKISADILTNISTGHGEVAPLQVTTDNMLIGVTSRAIDETDAKKTSGSGKKVVDLNDPTKHIHASWIEVGSVANLPKSSPFGLAVLNPYLQVNQWGKITRKDSNRKVLDATQADLRQKGHVV